MAEQIKEVLQLRGLNIRQETADVEDPESRRLVNFDPFRKPGALCVRKGRVKLLGQLPSNVIRMLAKLGLVRFQVTGRAIYRDGVAITAHELATNLRTQAASFRPLDDSAIWMFFADDDLMVKDDGERTYVWGIDEPLEPGPKVSNQTAKTSGDTIATGEFTIAVTQLRYDLSDDRNNLAFEGNG